MRVEDRELGPLLREAARQAAVDNMPVRANTLSRAATIAEENDALRARLVAVEAREARLREALGALLGHWDAFTDRGMSWGNQERAYYCLAKGAQTSWSNARAALTDDGAALAQAIEGVFADVARGGNTRHLNYDEPQIMISERAYSALRAAWQGRRA